MCSTTALASLATKHSSASAACSSGASCTLESRTARPVGVSCRPRTQRLRCVQPHQPQKRLLSPWAPTSAYGSIWHKSHVVSVVFCLHRCTVRESLTNSASSWQAGGWHADLDAEDEGATTFASHQLARVRSALDQQRVSALQMLHYFHDQLRARRIGVFCQPRQSTRKLYECSAVSGALAPRHKHVGRRVRAAGVTAVGPQEQIQHCGANNMRPLHRNNRAMPDTALLVHVPVLGAPR